MLCVALSYVEEGFTPVVDREVRSQRRLKVAALAGVAVLGVLALVAVATSDRSMGASSLLETQLQVSILYPFLLIFCPWCLAACLTPVRSSSRILPRRRLLRPRRLKPLRLLRYE